MPTPELPARLPSDVAADPPLAIAAPCNPRQSVPEGPGFANIRQKTALPLSGLTMLAVEDSRFASEALRLLCQRSGARLRRAETLAAARRHLAVYRPDVVLVDLGLPDGSGIDLIRELTRSGDCSSLVLAISGDPDGWSAAIRAGAAGFLDKPLESLAAFQAQILLHLTGPASSALSPDNRPIIPDRQALHDDLVRAAGLIGQDATTPKRYVADFLHGLARSSHDSALAGAATAARHSPEALQGLRQMLEQRLLQSADPFNAKPTR